jgi:hypothetical protein
VNVYLLILVSFVQYYNVQIVAQIMANVTLVCVFVKQGLKDMIALLQNVHNAYMADVKVENVSARRVIEVIFVIIQHALITVQIKGFVKIIHVSVIQIMRDLIAV